MISGKVVLFEKHAGHYECLMALREYTFGMDYVKMCPMERHPLLDVYDFNCISRIIIKEFNFRLKKVMYSK